MKMSYCCSHTGRGAGSASACWPAGGGAAPGQGSGRAGRRRLPAAGGGRHSSRLLLLMAAQTHAHKGPGRGWAQEQRPRWWRGPKGRAVVGCSRGVAGEHEEEAPSMEVRRKTTTKKEKRRENDQTVMDSTKRIYYGVENDEIYLKIRVVDAGTRRFGRKSSRKSSPKT